MMIEPLIQQYLAHLRENRSLAERTLSGYGQELGLFLRVIGKDATAEQVERDHVLAFLAGMDREEKPLAPATRNRKLIVLKGFFGWLIDQAVVKCDPTAGVAWARIPDTEKPVPSWDDYRAMLAHLATKKRSWLTIRDRAMVQTMFHTGIRVAEIVGARVGQVDLDGAVLTGLHRKGGAEQTLPLNRAVVVELRSWLAARQKVTAYTEHLFISRLGKGLSARQVERMVSTLGQQAGLALPVTPHTLRHMFATELSRNNVNLEIVRRLMNHKDIRTTSRYSHVGFEALREAVERLVEKPD